jgi:N6-adenosine-specific RNA methylase IME4
MAEPVRHEIEPGVFRDVADPFEGLPRGHFKAIYADPPWRFQTWDGRKFSGGNQVREDGSAIAGGSRGTPYDTMTIDEIAALPVADLCAHSSVLFMWATWPTLPDALKLIDAWGFTYKTCGFDWMKADGRQPDMFAENVPVQVGMGYWTRANSEPCLLATRGKPTRINADVRMGIIEPRREHSRKPDCVPARIERLVEGPYLELFARTQRPGWTVWGNQTDKFESAAA